MSARSEALAAYPALSLFIGGEWLGSSEAIPVLDPTSGAAIASLPNADDALLDRALQAAHDAFPGWRRTPAIDRGRLIARAAAWLRAHREQWGALIALELGKPIAQALAETDTACEILEWSAEEGRRLYGRQIPARKPNVRMTAIVDPVGPVGALAGWNAPAITPARKIAYALASGCSIVLKPSEATPASALMIARAFEAAGLPAGVLNIVFGDPPAIGRMLAGDLRIRLLTFTGGTAIGKALAAACAATLKRTVLELGGHAPVLVFADSDVGAVARAAVAAKFRNAGQVCTSPTRFLVERAAHDAFVEAFTAATLAIRTGDPFDPATAMGPLQNPRRVAGVRALIEDAVDRGATVAQGVIPESPGFWHPPTVLSNLHPDSLVLHEEPFGPVALIQPFDSADEAIAQANRLSFGLAAYAHTASLATAERLAREIEAGTLAINHWQASWPETPFGGLKDSGLGSEGGSEGLAAFCQTRFVSVEA